MKTWNDFIPALLGALLLPLILVALPTAHFNGAYWGGGPIREALLNAAFKVLPNEVIPALIYQFNHGGYLGELLIALPLALNVSAILTVFIYLNSLVLITLGAKKAAQIQDEKTKLAKEA